MNDLKQRLYDLSVKWEQTPIDNDLNIPSEIFKEVAVFEYLKMKNSDELILKGAEDDVVESIISETFGTYGKYIASKQRATVDYKIFKDEYIHFWHSIRKNKFKGEKINLLKNIICKSEFLVGNEDYGYYGWTYKSSEHLLSLCAKDLETHYWHNPRILRSLVPFYIILFALILAKDIDDDSPLIIYQQAIKNYRINISSDMVSALEWIVDCCEELYLDNEQPLLFKDKITISGITEFLEHFNY